MDQHAWSSVTHHGSDFFFHIRFVAVDEAFAACAFFVLKGAFVKPQECIFLELSALGTYFALGAVVVSAVNFYHVPDGFLFAFHSFMFWVRWLRLHVNQLIQLVSSCEHIKIYPKMLGVLLKNSLRFLSGGEGFAPSQDLFLRFFFIA
jgi:hypothetical protein